MPNSIITTSIFAKAAVRILENELVFARNVYRGLESEFDKRVNGYEVGDTVSIRKPTAFTYRSGNVASPQDIVEGKTSVTIDQQGGFDFQISSKDLTLNIGEIADRVIKPGMVVVANQIDMAVASLYKDIPNWVGTPGNVISSFDAFSKGPERLDLGAVPTDDRMAALSPSDHRSLRASQTALYMQDVAKSAYRKGRIGEIDDVETYKSQNVQTHTVGPLGGAPAVNGANQNVTYTAVKDSAGVPGGQTLITNGWTAAAAARVKKGDVFTIANVFDINPVTKAVLPHLKQFVVTADGASDAGGNLTLSISPAIITTGAFANVSAAPANGALLTFRGTANTGYAQNMIWNKNAFGLCVVPMVKPPGAVDVARESYKGLSVRVIPFYDGTNDWSTWRVDVLWGIKTLDPRLACRISG
ncbi:P22 phage major capsid protein family protein [Rhodoplanes serenus]|uniref:P22 phage major capsid protein family protein n=1 Tax=Rhodoplanes serenus TaxID=200615 RepID=UPI000DAC9659|nr:P22 phage major capsid protein family protein [Rhodoplanes serenus]RAI28422.1 hypothetical protein CH340_23630 [Rhodoplanes serenus]